MKNVEYLRKVYPKGTMVELHHMDDPQAPPSGTKGEVIFVDDMGTIHVLWENGCGLGLIPGEDCFSRI